MLNQRTGPWSEPVYLHSSGFDASILHDDDGRKYIVSLDWETREGYEKPIVTSNPIESNERHDPDHLKPKYFNPVKGTGVTNLSEEGEYSGKKAYKCLCNDNDEDGICAGGTSAFGRTHHLL